MNLVIAILRGLSQIFFIANPWTGALLLAAIAYASPWAALLFLLGSVVQTVTAHVMGLRDDAAAGLQGYNGALVGVAAMAHLGFTGEAVLLTVVGALAAVPVHLLVAAVLGSTPLARFELPVITAPFCVIGTGIFALMPAGDGVPLVTSSEPLTAVGLGIANSFSEVNLQDGWITGVIIFVALLIGSRPIAAFGLGGAVIAVLLGLAFLGPEEVSAGLLSYSALLAAAGIGAVFLMDLPLGWRVGLATAAALLTLPFVLLLGAASFPVLTWPFVLATWIVICGARAAGTKKGDTVNPVSPSDANA